MIGKISQYPDGGVVQPTDQFIVARAGNNYSLLGSVLPYGIFYVPTGVPPSTLGDIGNFAFRGDGTVGSFLYHKEVSGALAPRRQMQTIYSRNKVIFWSMRAGTGSSGSSWNPIL